LEHARKFRELLPCLIYLLTDGPKHGGARRPTTNWREGSHVEKPALAKASVPVINDGYEILGISAEEREEEPHR
jgi:hypothetical protein